MDYLLYEPEDFAADESYLRYYFRLNAEDVSFWENWISNNPERLDIIINADQLIGFLYFQLPREEMEKEYQRLAEAIEKDDSEKSSFIPSKHFQEALHISTRSNDADNTVRPKSSAGIRRISQWLAAACFAALIATGTYFYFVEYNGEAIDPATAGSEMQRTTNSSDHVKSIKLADGSAVALQPGAVLTYPHQFSPDKREVYLQGEAFFDVKKDSARSFFVYHKNLVTHVLGTSFNVKTDERTKMVEVAVRTGRVEVYEKLQDANEPVAKTGNGVILTPNQKVVYNGERKTFDATIVDVPLPIPQTAGKTAAAKAVPPAISFSEVSFGKIINTLEEMYGIGIEVEDDNIKNCHFSGDISDMNLYVKLDVICQALNASYEKKGTKIIVRGKGCN